MTVVAVMSAGVKGMVMLHWRSAPAASAVPWPRQVVLLGGAVALYQSSASLASFMLTVLEVFCPQFLMLIMHLAAQIGTCG